MNLWRPMRSQHNTWDPLEDRFASLDLAQQPDGWTSRSVKEGGTLDGLWPKNLVTWLVGFWLMLYIIRPWEEMFPWLGDLHFERFYCLTVIALAGMTGMLRLNFSREMIALVTLFAAMVMSGLLGIDASLASESTYKLVVHIAMFVILVSSVKCSKDMLFLVVIYVLAVGMYLWKAEWDYFVHDHHVYSMGVRRLVGIDLTYAHPNGVGASIVLSLPFWFLLWRSRERIRNSSIAWRSPLMIGIYAYPLLAGVAVLLTNSRGSMLGCIGFAILASISGTGFSAKVGRLLMIAVVAIAFFFFAMPESQRERLASIWDPNAGPESAHASADGRSQGRQAGWEMFKRFPLTGVGTGCFEVYRPTIDGSELQAHNLYAQIAGEFGMLGMVAFTFLVVAMFLTHLQVKKLTCGAETNEIVLLRSLSVASHQSLILLLYFGLGSSNMERFNWYFLAGIGVATLSLAQTAVAHIHDREFAT